MNKHLNFLATALAAAAALALAACQPSMMNGHGDMGDMADGGGPNEGKVAATVGSVEIVDPWARSAAMEGGNSAIYMTLRNTSGDVDRLVSASGEAATAIEIHETKMNDGVMQMQQVEGGIEVPANGSVALKPGGYHVMLIGLVSPLKAGDMLTVTLMFESGNSVELTVPVMDPM